MPLKITKVKRAFSLKEVKIQTLLELFPTLETDFTTITPIQINGGYISLRDILENIDDLLYALQQVDPKIT